VRTRRVEVPDWFPNWESKKKKKKREGE